MSVAALGLLAVAIAASADAGEASDPEEPLVLEGPVLKGIASGDVRATSAVVWARGSGPGGVVVELFAGPETERTEAVRTETELLDEAADWTAHLELADLTPSTRYRYRVRLTGGAAGEEQTGFFRTAPAAEESAGVRFAVGGDLGGQGWCRHAERGYAVFQAIEALEPDFFIANGDMVYADGECPGEGPEGWPNVPGTFPSVGAVDWTDPAAVREAVFAHWRYNFADPHLKSFLRSTPVWAQWDDHEALNDFGLPWAAWPRQPQRQGYAVVAAQAKEAVFAYHPIGRRPEQPGRIYRSFRWGRELEVYLLDGRSYRSANDLPDCEGKTLLGAEQRRWLEEGLTTSEATWKVVSSDVPLSVPTGSEPDLYGRDGFANGTSPGFSSRTGFEHELRGLLEVLDRANVENLVLVVTDVHFAMSLRYAVDLDGDGDELVFHELLNGPLNAGFAPWLPALDPTFRPVILFAEREVANFGFLRLERREDGTFHLLADVRGVDGQVRVGSALDLASRP